MFKHFIILQWKSFSRSSNLGKGLAIKILMIFFGIYMTVSLAGLGAGLYFIVHKMFPNTDPLLKVSEFMAYWILIEFLFRYFMQKIPVIDIKPLLLLPVKKSATIHYILTKSGLSFYNFLSLFLFIPFVIVLFLNGYPFLNLFFWLISIIGVVLTINYVNFLINKSELFFAVVALLIGVLYALEYFGAVGVSKVLGTIFYSIYQNPTWSGIPMVLAMLAYYRNYKFLGDRLFLDSSLKKKTRDAKTSDLSWTRKFGDIAPFLQLDLKLIWRNKRTKTQVFISLAMIFYGLIFYSMEDFGLTSPMMVFVGIFVTGIFLTNFGQFIPAWDSAYYSMIMSQNIPLRNYLESKAGLIALSIAAMFLLSIPYVYFGWQALAINFSCAVYNLGVNIPVILFFGSMNKRRIDLDKSAFANMQGTGAAQFLVIFPLFGVPMLLFLTLQFLWSFEVALWTLTVLGIIGLVFRKKLLDIITEIYRTKKYGMIAGFKEKNS